MKMKFCLSLPVLLLCGLISTGVAANGKPAEQQPSVDRAQVQELQEKMLKDSDIMSLILALQNDPEMQALLSDPAVLNAVQTGDINALTNMPRFMQLLNNPRIQEIQKLVKP
jgi:hypothetical protein